MDFNKIQCFWIIMLWYFPLKKKKDKNVENYSGKTPSSLHKGELWCCKQGASRAVVHGINVNQQSRPWPRGVLSRGFTSFLVNFGEWSFLSSIMIVAVAVPVNPTSSPAISWASMISSYLGFSSVYEAKTQQRGWHLDWSHCLGQVAGLRSADAVPPPSGQAPGKGSTLSGGGQTYLWSLSKQNSPYAWTGVGCGDGIYFLSLFKGACDTFQNVLSPGFGYTLHIWCLYPLYVISEWPHGTDLEMRLNLMMRLGQR